MPGSYLIKFTREGRLWIQIREDRKDIVSELNSDSEIKNACRSFWADSDGYSLEGSLSWFFEKDSELAKATLQNLRNTFGCKFSKEVKNYYQL